MQLLDGKFLSEQIKKELREEVDRLKSQGVRPPHLAAILVGDNPASRAYVRSKVKACEEVGFQSTLLQLDENVKEEKLLEIVEQYNKDKDLDGFIVQLPLPKHINELKVTLAIDAKKDVDGFHPENLGKMMLGLPCFVPATPLGVQKILERYDLSIAGKNCVVIGRSNIVGTPLSVLLSRKGKFADATVTMVHSRTQNLAEHCRQADVLIAAIGSPQFVKADMVKEGAIVIDVGINRIDDPNAKKGYRIVGDVDFENVAPKSSYITPVPGGVGLMTVTCLMWNTLIAAKRGLGLEE